jgi:hypothetical protein
MAEDGKDVNNKWVSFFTSFLTVISGCPFLGLVRVLFEEDGKDVNNKWVSLFGVAFWCPFLEFFGGKGGKWVSLFAFLETKNPAPLAKGGAG